VQRHVESGFITMVTTPCRAGFRRRRPGWRSWATAAGSLAASSLVLALPSAAQDDSFTLGEAITKALQEGVDARIARLEAERAGHAVGEVRSGYLPQVGLSSEAGWSNRLDDTFIASDKNGNPAEYSLATIAPDRAWLQLHLTQTLFDLRQWREIEREQLSAEAAQVAETRDRDEVAYEVMRRYVRLVELERKAAMAHEQLVEAQWLSDQAGHLSAAGRALDVDHSLVDLHRSDAELAIRSWEYEIDSARAALWIAVGEDEPLRIPLAPDSLPEIDPEHAAYGALEAVQAAPELRILDLHRRIKHATVEAEKAGRFPTLRFVSGYANYGPKRFDAYKDEVWVGIDLEVPIFDGFRSGHAIRGAESEADIARLRYQRMLTRKRARVQELIQQLETGQQRLDLARKRSESAEEQVRLADLNLRAERGDLRGAVAARERRTRLALEAIDAEYEQVELWASLQRELGRLTFSVLGPIASAPVATP
jgi:outer membrane protein TolC